MELILNEKALKYLENIEDNVNHKDDEIKIVKEKNSFKIFQNGKKIYERHSKFFYEDTDTQKIEKIFALDGIYIVSECNNHRYEKFEKDNLTYYNNIISNDHFNMEFDESKNSFIYCLRNIKVIYNISCDEVILEYNGNHIINQTIDVSEQVNKIVESTKNNVKLIKEDIKIYIEKLLKTNNIDIDIVNKKLLDKNYEKFESHLSSEIIKLEDCEINKIVFAIENIKNYYLKFVKYINNKHLIFEEIDKLNSLLEKYYSKNQEYERKLDNVVKELKKKYNV